MSGLISNLKCEKDELVKTEIIRLTFNIPSLGRQRCLPSGVLGGPHGFFVISQLFDAVDYSNYVFLFF